MKLLNLINKKGYVEGLIQAGHPELAEKYRRAEYDMISVPYAESFESRPQKDQDLLNDAFRRKSQVQDWVNDHKWDEISIK
jgi:hypothetical protein